jgi:Acyl-CoA dehydrogenase, C-terminal domain
VTAMDTPLDVESLGLLDDALRKTMQTKSGPALDAALVELGWPEMLAELPDTAIPLVFRALGETGAHAPIINDVVLAASGRDVGGTVALPYSGGNWVIWERRDATEADTVVDAEVPVVRSAAGDDVPLVAGRAAVGWWLVGTSRAMLQLARTHALDRVQFGRPIASFQAVRHRLAETLVAIEGAEATLSFATDEVGAILAKAAAGHAALTAARHCQQVLGGIGFTAEHDLHRHVKRALLLDGLLGSSRELTREAGRIARTTGSAPRVAHL